MKTKELIEALLRADPSGEAEVVSSNGGNIPLRNIELKEGYWDGSYGQLIRDPRAKGYYDIVGYNITRKGYKLVLNFMSYWDMICNDPTFPVYQEMEPYNPNFIEEHRKNMLAIEQQFLFRPSDNKCLIIFDTEAESLKFWQTFREEFLEWRVTGSEVHGDKTYEVTSPGRACIETGHGTFVAREITPERIDRLWEMLGTLEIDPLVFHIYHKEPDNG